MSVNVSVRLTQTKSGSICRSAKFCSTEQKNCSAEQKIASSILMYTLELVINFFNNSAIKADYPHHMI